jgi:cobalt-zinc-cadmium efflux system outer membrane protein
MRAGIAILLLMTEWTAVFGQNEPNTFVTLDDYLQYAEAHSAGIKNSFYQWQEALEQIPQAKALPDPRLSYSYFVEPVETRVGPQRQRIGINQTFPWFGKIDARTETAVKEASAAKQKYEAARLALFREVKAGFYEYAYLAGATEIARENLELSKHFEEVAQTKHLTSATGHPDVIRAQIETAKMENVLQGLEQLREPTMSRLRTALTLPAETNLPWPRREDFNVTELDYELLTNILRQRNPQLAALMEEQLAAKSKIDLAEKNFYPDISVGVDWTQTDPARMSGVEDSGKDAVMLTFSLNLPLWRDNYRGAVRQAQARKASIEQERINTENTILTQASQAYYGYKDSVRNVRLYRDTLIPKGTELLRVSEAAYRAGTIDFLSLIDAQRILLEYYLSYERALANNREKLAELEMLAGTELN